MFTARYELHLLYNIQVNFLLERVNVLKLSYSVWREGDGDSSGFPLVECLLLWLCARNVG